MQFAGVPFFRFGTERSTFSVNVVMSGVHPIRIHPHSRFICQGYLNLQQTFSGNRGQCGNVTPLTTTKSAERERQKETDKHRKTPCYPIQYFAYYMKNLSLNLICSIKYYNEKAVWAYIYIIASAEWMNTQMCRALYQL